MRNKSFFILSLLIFLAAYSVYVFILNFNVDNYSDIIVATTFFFTLFSGFFITRQNDRYSAIADEISNTDGLFSLLYRVAGAVPGVQVKVREALRDHYQKILDSNNWAYHILNPSTTITQIFDAYNNATGEDAEKLGKFGDAFGGALASLQVSRKRMVMLYQEKLLALQWALVILLGALMVVSFNFIPNHTLVINILKIVFGVAVLFVLLLLKQLDELSIFGKDFNERTANDILRIIEEKDIAEIKKTR
jgi:hypothetical protein